MAGGLSRLLAVGLVGLAIGSGGACAQSPAVVPAGLEERLAIVAPKVESWWKDIHANPELGNMEVRTSKLVADHLRRIGLDEVRTGIANTGVVGVLRGGKPGPVLALRADMDALPILEATGVPFASVATAMLDGKVVPVMHACGHDAHTAMLMGAAEVLAGMRANLHGTILFVFQPAEEGVTGETAGAKLMLQEGVFASPRPEAIFALHVEPGPVGRIEARRGAFLSSATNLSITLMGRQTHAGRPWEGTDIVNLSADVIKALTTISARRVNVFHTPSVVSIGSVQIGQASNVIPGEARLRGTIRTYDIARRDTLMKLVTESVDGLAATYGATAQVDFEEASLVTGNDPALLDRIAPSLARAASDGVVHTDAPLRGAAEDMSYFQTVIPGLYYILGSTPGYTTPDVAPTNHSDRFMIDPAVLRVGVKAHVLSALAFLSPAPR